MNAHYKYKEEGFINRLPDCVCSGENNAYGTVLFEKFSIYQTYPTLSPGTVPIFLTRVSDQDSESPDPDPELL